MVWTYSFLRCSGVPGGNGSILDVSQWAFFTSVACRISLVVGVDNPAWGSHFTHVKEHVPSGVHGGDWLHPRTWSLANRTICSGSGHVQADVVDSLWEGSILVTVAGVLLCCVGHRCLIHGVPVSKILKRKGLVFMCFKKLNVT